MSMIFDEAPKNESSIQRAARLRREREDRARQKPKAEKEAEEEAAREAALATALPTSSKGFKMMAKFGFKQGDTLGKSENARKEPVQISVKEDKGGIGLESEKKRKFREQAEKILRDTKRSKVEEVDYRTAQRQRLKEEKQTKDLENAQRTAERLDDKEGEGKDMSKVPLKSINILWRSLARRRLERLRDRQEKTKLANSLSSRLPQFEDEDDEDAEYRHILGHETYEAPSLLIEDLEEEDPEWEDFEALPVADRLQKVADHLRETHRYCFWCGYDYPDPTMDGCPGTTEEAHEV